MKRTRLAVVIVGGLFVLYLAACPNMLVYP